MPTHRYKRFFSPTAAARSNCSLAARKRGGTEAHGIGAAMAAFVKSWRREQIELMQVNEETPSFTSGSSAILIRISDTRRRIGSAVFAGRHDLQAAVSCEEQKALP
jgi:hypothetical protein